jgi:hypothetical protein
MQRSTLATPATCAICPDVTVDRPMLPPPDRLTLWPVEGGRFGLDAVFSGAFGRTYAKEHRAALKAGGLKASMRQERGDETWTLRMGPLTADAARAAVDGFLGL